jgi:hypothetical protein
MASAPTSNQNIDPEAQHIISPALDDEIQAERGRGMYTLYGGKKGLD